MSLRQKKKEKIKARLESTAREIFLSHGYEKTTVAEIAEKAGIAVGTFYNYFASKAELFSLLFFVGPESNAREKAEMIVSNPGHSVLETLHQLLDVYMDASADILQQAPKKLWKDIIAAFASNVEAHEKTLRYFIQSDFTFMAHIGRLIQYYQAQGQLVDSFDPMDAARCIYGICFTPFPLYLLEEDQSFQEMKSNLFRHVDLFFSNKLRTT